MHLALSKSQRAKLIALIKSHYLHRKLRKRRIATPYMRHGTQQSLFSLQLINELLISCGYLPDVFHVYTSDKLSAGLNTTQQKKKNKNPLISITQGLSSLFIFFLFYFHWKCTILLRPSGNSLAENFDIFFFFFCVKKQRKAKEKKNDYPMSHELMSHVRV